MKQQVLTLLAAAIAAFALSAQVPQFSPQNFEGWVYTNPATELNASNIQANRIYLYVTSTGLDLTLTSPQFDCRPGETIDMTVTTVTTQWQNESFVPRKVVLTATLLDSGGTPVDSVTQRPGTVNKINTVNLSIMVPPGLRQARLRFAAWDADVDSNPAIRMISMTSMLRGDVNLDGELSVADINAVLDVILGSTDDEALYSRADLNNDDEVTVADVNDLIDLLLQ